MKKGLLMFTLLATTLSGAAHADSAAIKQLLAKLGVQSSDVQPSPVKGISTVLTDSGVLYVTDDGKHIIQGPMYDVSGAQPVNVTNALLGGEAKRPGKRDDRLQSAAGKTCHHRLHRYYLRLLPQAA